MNVECRRWTFREISAAAAAVISEHVWMWWNKQEICWRSSWGAYAKYLHRHRQKFTINCRCPGNGCAVGARLCARMRNALQIALRSVTDVPAGQIINRTQWTTFHQPLRIMDPFESSDLFSHFHAEYIFIHGELVTRLRNTLNCEWSEHYYYYCACFCHTHTNTHTQMSFANHYHSLD